MQRVWLGYESYIAGHVNYIADYAKSMAGHEKSMAGYVKSMAFVGGCALGPSGLCAVSLLAQSAVLQRSH